MNPVRRGPFLHCQFPVITRANWIMSILPDGSEPGRLLPIDPALEQTAAGMKQLWVV